MTPLRDRAPSQGPEDNSPRLPLPAREAHGDAVWVQVVAVGPVVKVHFIEGLRGGADNAAPVVKPVAVLGDDHLAQGHGSQELDLGAEARAASERARRAAAQDRGGPALTLWPPDLCLKQVMETT